MRIAADATFALSCVAILQAHHVARASGNAVAGWCASHARRATELAGRLAEGEPTAADLEEATALASRYSKRLAAHFRAAELAERPELHAVAAVFGVRPRKAMTMSTIAASEPKTDGVASSVAVAETALPPRASEAGVVAPAPTKKRGRPLGSKNKVAPRDAAKAPRRRR